MDGFAVEVYELSAYLAVLCGDVPQLAATVPRLVLELYPSVPTGSDKENGGHDDVVTSHRICSCTTQPRIPRRRGGCGSSHSTSCKRSVSQAELHD